MKNESELNLAISMSSKNTDIIPYLPELLQDLWELGSESNQILDLIKDKVEYNEIQNILDLGCGKGAVSVKLAKELKRKVKGIDIIPEFIQTAKLKAIEYDVADLCSFEICDINQAINNEKNYDCLIWGAVGRILGSYKETLTKISATVREGGYLIIDDCFVQDVSNNKYLRYGYEYPTLLEWENLISEAGLSIVEQRIYDEKDMTTDYDKDFGQICKRAKELSNRYKDKDKEWLFNKYVEDQRNEYYDLQNNAVGILWLLKKQS